jgi:hypothetical protein
MPLKAALVVRGKPEEFVIWVLGIATPTPYTITWTPDPPGGTIVGA